MACFQLVDCQDGVTVMWVTDDTLNPTLVPGQVISCNEVQGHCLEVRDFGGQCIPSGPPITGIIVFPGGCQECLTPLCACPQGTTEVILPDGSRVCRQDIVVPATGPSLNACQQVALGINQVLGGFTPNQWGPSPQYSRYGARFHGETSGLSWPLSLVTGCAPGTQNFIDFSSSTVLPISANIVNPLWGDGSPANTGRYNVAGVTPHPYTPCAEGIGFQRGFTFCLNVLSTTTYSFGIGGININITINGLVFINNNNATKDIFTYENWNVFQLTLPPGSYIIQMASDVSGGVDSCGAFFFNSPPFAARIPGSTPGAAFEIYQETAANLSNTLLYPNAAALAPVIIYSTLNEVGQKYDYGGDSYNYKCPCPPPPLPPITNPPCPDAFGNYNLIVPILDNCTINPLNPNASPDIYVCHTYIYTQVASCCYLLTNCDPTASPATVLTSTNLASEIGNVITVNGPPGGVPIIGCFIVSLGQCDGSEIAVTVVQSFGPAADGGCDACAPKCYMLEDCEGIIPAFIVNTNLSAYVGQIVQLCPTTPAFRETNTINIITCCMILTDCCDPNNKIKVQCPTLPGMPGPNYFGLIINIPSLGPGCWIVDPVGEDCLLLEPTLPIVPVAWISENVTVHQQCSDCGPCGVTLTQCGCFIVTLAGGCQGAIPLPGVITANYQTCADCLPKCYLLVDCSDSNNTIIASTNLASYVGQVIFIDGCPGTCWLVLLSPTCVGAIPVVVTDTFIDCDTCLNIPPPPPLELNPRKIKPGYDTPGCDPAYTERVSCNFANAVYDQMTIIRYGITMCCNEPIQKWDIKKQLLDLRAIYDPELCQNTFNKCCPPCAMVAEIVVYDPRTCDPPTGMIAVIELPPVPCIAPITMEASITIP